MDLYYLYRHIRLDKNIPFYIGIGKYNSNINYTKVETKFKRAYSNKFRSKTWNYIINKCNYKIDILYITNNINEIRLKEIEFIKLYGRRDLNNGTLVNHTDGGDGRLNPNKESIKNNGNNWKGISGKNHRKAKTVYQYDMNGNFIKQYDTITHASEENNIGITGIIKNCKNEINYFKEYQWFYTYQGNKINSCKTVFEKAYKRVGKYNKNTKELIKEYNSIKEATIDNNIKYQQHIGACCRNQIKTYRGFIWKYL